MAKKKWWRIIVAMQCKECGKTNYHTSLNKTITQKLELKVLQTRQEKNYSRIERKTEIIHLFQL